MKQIDVPAALKQINCWFEEGRVVKVAIIGAHAQTVDSGWGSAMTDNSAQLRLVYKTDSGGAEVDQTFDVSGSTATESAIWDAPPALREKYGRFDEGITFALPNGGVILLTCTFPDDERSH
jgi:hypothetical protein